MHLVATLTGEMSRIQLYAALKLTHQDNFTTVYLQPTLKAGLIEMTLPDKPMVKTSATAEPLKARLWPSKPKWSSKRTASRLFPTS